MQVRDSLDEEILVEAFNQRQRTEVLKVKAIITAATNPEKAHDAFMSYLEAAMPEYAEVRAAKDARMMESFDTEMGTAFVLSGDSNGMSAVQVDR